MVPHTKESSWNYIFFTLSSKLSKDINYLLNKGSSVITKCPWRRLKALERLYGVVNAEEALERWILDEPFQGISAFLPKQTLLSY